MKAACQSVQRLVLTILPTLATAAIATPSVQAATFSLSETQIDFFDFSSPEATDLTVTTNTNAVTVATQGQVAAQANAEAVFLDSPPIAGNFANSTVSGSGTDYWGTAQSDASVTGRFAVKNSFSFSFQALLNLYSSVDDATAESTRASGEVLFQLFDSTNPQKLTLLDTFSLSGALDSTSPHDFLKTASSPYLTLFPTSNITQSFGGNQEFATATIEGVYQRTFTAPLFITLVESKRSQTDASAPVNAGAVPEPFTILGTMISIGYGVVLKRRRAIRSSDQ